MGRREYARRAAASLAHLTVLDTTPPELVTVAAAAGFRTIGIRLTATPSVGVPPTTCCTTGRCCARRCGGWPTRACRCFDTEFLRFEPEQPIGIPEGFLEVSARLGAKYVLVMSAEPVEARTLDRFVELCDRAAAYNLQVSLEFADLHRRSHPRPRRRHGGALEAPNA